MGKEIFRNTSAGFSVTAFAGPKGRVNQRFYRFDATSADGLAELTWRETRELVIALMAEVDSYGPAGEKL